MKKLLSIILLVALLAGMVLTGCSNNPPAGEKPNDNEQQTSQPKEQKDSETDDSEVEDPLAKYKPDPNKKYVIEWCGGHDTEPLSEDAIVELYLEEKFNIELNYWYIERDQWNEVLNLRFAAGEVPDIIRVEGAMNLQTYIEQEIVMPVSLDIINEYAPNLTQLLLEYNENCFQNVSYQGQNYGFPRVNVNGSYNYAPVWRIDWLKNVGIEEIPRTLEECETAFYKFRNEDPDQNGQKDTYALSDFGMRPIYGAFGALPDRFVELDGEITYGAIHPGMKDALTLLSKWYADEIIDPEFVTSENHGSYWALSDDFINGKLGFSSPGAYYHNNPPLYEGDNGGRVWRTFNAAVGGTTENPVALDMYGIGYNPVGPTGLHGNEKWDPNGDEMVAFGSHLEEEPDKLGKVLEVLDGIAGDFETYFFTEIVAEWESDDYVVLPSGAYERKEELDENRNEGDGNPFRAIETPQFVKKLNPASFEWADSMPQFSAGGYEPLIPVTLPSQGKYWGELEKLREEAYVRIITGERPIDYFDTFVEEWYSLGGEQIIKEANEYWSNR